MGQRGLGGPPLYRTGGQVSSCWSGRGQGGQRAPGPWVTQSPGWGRWGGGRGQPIHGVQCGLRVTLETVRMPSWAKSQGKEERRT